MASSRAPAALPVNTTGDARASKPWSKKQPASAKVLLQRHHDSIFARARTQLFQLAAATSLRQALSRRRGRLIAERHYERRSRWPVVAAHH